MTSPLPSPTDGDSGSAATATLAVAGMHCGSCVALIEETLAEQPGVRSASVDLDSARAVVDYDPSLLGVEQLTAAISEAGYAATPAG